MDFANLIVAFGLLALTGVGAVASCIEARTAQAARFDALEAKARAEQARDETAVLAKDANDIAEEAARVSKAAHDLARDVDARAREAYDVEWSVGLKDEHHLFVMNYGLDEARNVRFRVRFPSGGQMRHDEPLDVPPWTSFDIPWDSTFNEQSLASGDVLLRVVWTSPAGQPFARTVTTPGAQVLRSRPARG